MNKFCEPGADIFCQHGIDRCFALLGDANMHWAGAMHERGVKFVYTRHEHAAVAGAAAYARALGKIGCASVTCGPGLTQIMTILPIAVRAHIPMIIFAGEAPIGKAWYNQMIDQEIDLVLSLHYLQLQIDLCKYIFLHAPPLFLTLLLLYFFLSLNI